MVENDHSFSRAEIGPIVVVSLISALRLLGIFLILPIFSAYVVRYSGATLALAGIAFGIYALTQCIIQVPLGWASDRWGRRPVLVFGLALFSLGSLGCALANNVTALIFARALQGSGPLARSRWQPWPTSPGPRSALRRLRSPASPSDRHS